MTENQFLHRVPWGQAVNDGEHIRFYGKDMCPIDALGGKWGAPGGALGLPKTLHHAIITAADVKLATLKRQREHYVDMLAGRIPKNLHEYYRTNLERIELTMRLRILFRARMSDARSFKENSRNV